MDNNQLCFYVDTTRCTNCKTCEIACKDINDAAVGVRLRRVYSCERGDYPMISVVNVSVSCHHCENPVCAMACPAGALSKREQDGIVVLDTKRCTGCRQCVEACPFGAPQYDGAARKVRKCNMCLELLEKGEAPACVSACPMRAIEIGFLSDITAGGHVADTVCQMPSSAITKPTTRYKILRTGVFRQP